MSSKTVFRNLLLLGLAAFVCSAWADPQSPSAEPEAQLPYATELVAFYDAMTVPKPFEVREGVDLTSHQETLRRKLLKDMALAPLPERLGLDLHRSAPIDHPWCTLEKVEFQIWPQVYSSALLYTPKEFQERPGPAVLCPHGHWERGYAHPEVQKRCLTLAKMGYVVLSTRQNHTEDLRYGLSHQTTMVWTNMRGLDLLQSLPEVDPERIGAAGASGGGLQTQMITALDPRVKAAVIVGLTCDFREIMFPHATHCGCNHFPNFMSYTDFPEIASLASPRPLQFLTMNDWTRHFAYDNYPGILDLYRRNGHPERTACTYWPTPHLYDQPKRERSYWWMEKWLRNGGEVKTEIPAEPEPVQTYPAEMLDEWPVQNPANQGLEHIPGHFRDTFGFKRPDIDTAAAWSAHKSRMSKALGNLLELDNALPRAGQSESLGTETIDGVVLEHVLIASEGPVRLPGKILRPNSGTGPWPVTLVLCKTGSRIDQQELTPLAALARQGRVVALADVRFSGGYHLPGLAGAIRPETSAFQPASPRALDKDPQDQQKNLLVAWERNSVCWGYPLIAMTLTDIRAVLDHLAKQSYADTSNITIETHDLAHLALAAVFAAILDEDIRELSLDLRDSDYAAYEPFHQRPEGLPVIPFILRYADVPQWIAALADRKVTVHHLARAESEGPWLQDVSSAAGNPGGIVLGVASEPHSRPTGISGAARSTAGTMDFALSKGTRSLGIRGRRNLLTNALPRRNRRAPCRIRPRTASHPWGCFAETRARDVMRMIIRPLDSG